MADYVFGLPENDPNYKSTEQKKPEEEQDSSDAENQSPPPAPKVASSAAPLPVPEPHYQDNQPVVRNQAAIKRGAGHVPVEPPPDLQTQSQAPATQSSAQPQVLTEALPPTAGKLPFFEPEATRKPKRVRQIQEFEDNEEDDEEDDENVRPVRKGTTRPRRSMSNQFNKENAEKAKQTIGDAVPIAQYYLSQVQRVLFAPSDFFSEMQDEVDLTEAAIFMAITLGVCGVLRLLCGDFWALVHFFGGVLIVGAASFGGTYLLRNMLPEQRVEFNTVFAIFCYAQAPKLIAWLNLGILPIGYWVSNIYSLAIACIALEKVYGMSKMKAGLVVSGLFAAAGLLAWFLHL